MEPLRLSEVVAAVGASVTGDASLVVTGVSIDSRTLRPGDVYVAIRGKRLDGHEFIRAALAAGAVAIVADNAAAVPEGAVGLLVGDTTRALGRIATRNRERVSARCVAITGSNGKTTTKEMLASMLSRRFRTLRSEGSFNNDIGLPLTVLRMDRSTEAAVFEIEMNELGGTARLATICRPETGVITNIGDTHLEFMRDRHGVAKEKAELLQSLPESGVAVLNADDPMVMGIGEAYCPRNRVTFGLEGAADFFATNVEYYGLDGCRFLLLGRHAVSLPIPGRHSVLNCLAACAAASVMGMSLTEMPEAVEGFVPPPLRLHVRRVGPVTLIEDCYNANPQSMRAAFDVLARSSPPSRCIAFLGDMLELGAVSALEHESLGREVSRVVSRMVLVGNQAEYVERGAIAAGFDPANIRRFGTSSEAARFDLICAGDTILIKGSRAMAMELISQEIAEHYEQ